MTIGKRETVIIGGGIHGTSTALALAARGKRSLILEAGPRLFQGASIRNEGKLHLGFVYALDQSGSTTRSMVEGSLAFAPLVERWCGEVSWDRLRSERFAYVAMDEGLAGPDQLETHYESVLAEMKSAATDYGSNYLGVDQSREGLTRHDEIFPGMVEGHSGCWFDTPERSVDPIALGPIIKEAVRSEPAIEVRTDHRVTGARRIENGFELEVGTPGGTQTIEAGAVVNAAWDGRPALDQMILENPVTTNFRVKYQVMIRGGDLARIRAATLAQGPFGDVVPWPNGDVYINWYPAARTHFGDQPLEKLRAERAVADSVHELIADLFPALKDFSVARFAPCYILAEGQTDIGDPASGLHARKGAEFVEADGWWSIRSTKLTTGPLAGERCAARITGTEPGI